MKKILVGLVIIATMPACYLGIAYIGERFIPRVVSQMVVGAAAILMLFAYIIGMGFTDD